MSLFMSVCFCTFVRCAVVVRFWLNSRTVGRTNLLPKFQNRVQVARMTDFGGETKILKDLYLLGRDTMFGRQVLKFRRNLLHL
jgi:hypothetical protein